MSGFAPTTDSRKARSFYEGALGMAFVQENDYVIVFRTEHAMIVMHKLKEFEPAHYTVLGWEVEDIRNTIAILKGRGIVFERYGWMEQDNLAIWKSPDGASVAWFKDPDGNILSVSQLRKSGDGNSGTESN
jgi:predicted enzyme related to lactoylglutathione lyase